MKIGPLLQPDSAVVLESPSSWPVLARALAGRLAANLPGTDEEQLALRLASPSFPVEEGVGFPHLRVEGLDRTALIVALIRGGVEVSGQRAELVFLLVGPADAGWQHLRLLARLARLCHRPGLLERLRESRDAGELLERLRAEDASG